VIQSLEQLSSLYYYQGKQLEAQRIAMEASQASDNDEEFLRED
jgi:hypothetical protein